MRNSSTVVNIVCWRGKCRTKLANCSMRVPETLASSWTVIVNALNMCGRHMRISFLDVARKGIRNAGGTAATMRARISSGKSVSKSNTGPSGAPATGAVSISIASFWLCGSSQGLRIMVRIVMRNVLGGAWVGEE